MLETTEIKLKVFLNIIITNDTIYSSFLFCSNPRNSRNCILEPDAALTFFFPPIFF